MRARCTDAAAGPTGELSATTSPMAYLLDQKTARALLEEHGWILTRGGKHGVKMEKAGRRPITLPRHGGRTYGKGLSAAIRKQAGLDG